MDGFENELAGRLAELRAKHLFRELRRVDAPQSTQIECAGRNCLNFSSNDYLGLANEPALKEAARQAIERFGAGSGSARLICGSLAPHHELEETLAAFKGTTAALAFSTGYAAALGTVPALVGPGDVVVLDRLVHACLVDAARLSGAKLRVFAHNDLGRLEDILRWADRRLAAAAPAVPAPHGRRSRVLIVTESVFSMDGDHAPLRALVELKDRYGAWLMVDEAHATGLYGARRRGCAEAQGVADRVEVQMGTLGKAVGAAGGYLCGSRALIDYLINRARSFIFSTGPVPAATAAATAGIRFVQSDRGAERCALLWARVAQLRQVLANPPAGRPATPPATSGEPTHCHTGAEPAAPSLPSAILPLILGDEAVALSAAAVLQDQGLFVPAVRFPTVPRGTARLRVTLTAVHTEDQVARLAAVLRSLRTPGAGLHIAHASACPT